MIGNDFKPPDHWYLGDGKGGLEIVTADDGLIPRSTWSTMTIASGDIDNDLRSEIYIGQITGFDGQSRIERRAVEPERCEEFSGGEQLRHCERVMRLQAQILRGRSTKDPFRCMSAEEDYREDCMAVLLLHSAAIWNRDPNLCDLFPETWPIFSFVCNESFEQDVDPSEVEAAAFIPQVRNKNVLLSSKASDSFQDRAKELGLDVGGWTWNAKFADLDNDEWQDLYVVNGEFYTGSRESNIFFHNVQGASFENRTEEFGLESFFAASSYVYSDFDNDGDVDIIVAPVVGPVIVFRNRVAGPRAIAFELLDKSRNPFGIGAKVTIHYGPDQTRHQFREIHLGGGFASYDPLIAHFGLGQHDSVGRVEVEWPTGEHTELVGPFSAGARYSITRDVY